MLPPSPFHQPSRDGVAEKEADDASIEDEWARMQARGRARSSRRLLANAAFVAILAVGIGLSLGGMMLLRHESSPRKVGRGLALPIALSGFIGIVVRKRLLPKGQH